MSCLKICVMNKLYKNILNFKFSQQTITRKLFLPLVYKMTAWTDFVSKVFKEERAKNPAFQFKDALKMASKRKSEMGSSSSAAAAPGKTMKKRGKSKKSKKRGGKSRRKK